VLCVYIIRFLDGLTGATRRNLQTRPKILKNLFEHQINQSQRKTSPNKVFLVRLKSVTEPKHRIGNSKKTGLKLNSKSLNLKKKSV
jgi:hypothetical protein